MYAFSIPTIMAKKLVKTPINTEDKKQKKSYIASDIEFDFHLASELFISNQVSMESLKAGRYSEKELKNLCDKAKCRFPGNKTPSISAMKQGLISAYEIVLSGNSECHKYVIKPGWTGGWVDCFCEHGFKVISKQLCNRAFLLIKSVL